MKYIGKKLITLIMTLFLVSVAAFLAFQIIPGDVVTSILGTEATPEREEQLREELGGICITRGSGGQLPVFQEYE